MAWAAVEALQGNPTKFAWAPAAMGHETSTAQMARAVRQGIFNVFFVEPAVSRHPC